MPSQSPVEIADRVSRRRAAVVAAAVIAFVLIHVALRPFGFSTPRAGVDWWAVNAAVLLAGLATGGGLLNRRQIQVLVNDEVSRDHYRTSVGVGYWIAMTAAFGLYLLPSFHHLSARDAVYAIVTPAVAVALLAFSYLEYRAHRDG